MKRTKFPSNDFPSEVLLIEAFKSTGYLIINKTLIKQLGLIPAVILSNYIDKHIYFRENFPENNGWFFLTHKQQTEQLGLSDHQIRQAKKELFKKDFIQTKLKGTPAKEWYHINFNILYIGLALENLKGLPSKNLRTINIKETKLKENKNNNTLLERNKSYFPLAKYLSEIIQTSKNINHTSTQLKTWSNDIRQLIENNKISPKRIKQALQWYEQNIGGQYIPVIESGSSLRNKFTKLEDAMQRENNYDNKPKYIIEYGERWNRGEDGDYRNAEGRIFTE